MVGASLLAKDRKAVLKPEPTALARFMQRIHHSNKDNR